METKPQYDESRPGATLPGVVGHQGTAAGGGSPQKSKSITTENAQLLTETGNIGGKRTRLQETTTAGCLENKLIASSTTNQSSYHEVTMEEANARFLKYLQQTYNVSKSLDEEVAAAFNTKREIKTLIAQLSNTVRGLIQWGRQTGKVSVSTSSRGTQTDPGPPVKEHPATKTTEALLGSHIGKVLSSVPAPEDIVPSPDRTRFELPAAIEGLRQMVKTQGEFIAKLAEKVEKIQIKPRQQRQKSPPRQQVQLKQQQQLRSDPQDQLLCDDAANWETVSRTRKKTRREPHTRIIPDAVIVKAGNMTYADMLKNIKTSHDMEGVSGTIRSITKTKNGHLRLVLNRESLEIESLHTAIKNAIGNEASCNRLTDRATIEIRDADEEATDEEIIRSLGAHTKVQGTAREGLWAERPLQGG